VFDIGFGELLVLAVLGLFVFGPEKLPKIISDATRTLRELRRMAQGAQRELTDSLDVDLKGIDLQSLDPRTFVRRTLMEDDIEGDARSDREQLQRRSESARGAANRDESRARSRRGAGSSSSPASTQATSQTSTDDEAAAPIPAPARQPAPWDDDIT